MSQLRTVSRRRELDLAGFSFSRMEGYKFAEGLALETKRKDLDEEDAAAGAGAAEEDQDLALQNRDGSGGEKRNKATDEEGTTGKNQKQKQEQSEPWVRIDFVDVAKFLLSDGTRLLLLYLGIAVANISIAGFVQFFPLYDFLFETFGIGFYTFPLPLTVGLVTGYSYTNFMILLLEWKKTVAFYALILTTFCFLIFHWFGHVNYDFLVASRVGEVEQRVSTAAASAAGVPTPAKKEKIHLVTENELSLAYKISPFRFEHVSEFGYETQANWCTSLVYAVAIGLAFAVLYEHYLTNTAMAKHYFLLKRQAKRVLNQMDFAKKKAEKREFYRQRSLERSRTRMMGTTTGEAKEDLDALSSRKESSAPPPAAPSERGVFGADDDIPARQREDPSRSAAREEDSEQDIRLAVPMRPDKTDLLRGQNKTSAALMKAGRDEDPNDKDEGFHKSLEPTETYLGELEKLARPSSPPDQVHK
ncbi:unnamed protein product [Amoebophrya sp. A120]|nr:unnamed protein product [Amoebophrya sp. A120]|eukprot:GSA120T00007358001.1